VTFELAGVTLRATAGAPMVSPYQLAGEHCDDSADLDHLLVLLDSLDADHDPTNGIAVVDAEGTPTTLPVPLVTPGVFGMVTTTLVETLLVVSKRVPGAEGKPGMVTPLVAPGLGLLVVSSNVPGEVPGKPGKLVSVRLPLLVRLSNVPGL